MTFGLLVRLILSLSVVIGGLLAVRWWGLRGGSRLRGIKVVARAPLGRSASVAVLEVGSRRYLVGAAEQSVNLLAELDPDVPYLLYCRSGNRSGQTRALMEQLGFSDVADVDGGVIAWADSGLPLTTG